MITGKVILAGSIGDMVGNIPPSVQGSLESVELSLCYADGSAVDLTGATLSGTFSPVGDEGTVYVVTGALMPSSNQTRFRGRFTWERSAFDVGLAGEFTLQIHATIALVPLKSFAVLWEVHPNQNANAITPPSVVGATVEDLATVQAFAIQRANHTGSQSSSTISDFAATVRATVLTGLSTATDAAITAADTVLTGFGKLQAQITGHKNATGTAVHGLGTMATEAAADYLAIDGSNADQEIDIQGENFVNTGLLGVGTDSPASAIHAEAAGDTDKLGMVRLLNTGATTPGRFTTMYLGNSVAAGGAGQLGYYSDTVDKTNAFLFLLHYGDSENTQSIALRQGGKVGIGTGSPAVKLHINYGNTPGTAVEVLRLEVVGNAGADRGPRMDFYAPANSGTAALSASIGGLSSALSTGQLVFYTVSGGSLAERMRITSGGGVVLSAMRSGATQATAGAAAGELWKTASHATLPDNVVLHGV